MFNLGYLFFFPKYKKKINKTLSEADIEKNFLKFKNKYSRTFTDFIILRQKKIIKYNIPEIKPVKKRKQCFNCDRIMYDTHDNFCNKDCKSTFIIINLDEENQDKSPKKNKSIK